MTYGKILLSIYCKRVKARPGKLSTEIYQSVLLRFFHLTAEATLSDQGSRANPDLGI